MPHLPTVLPSLFQGPAQSAVLTHSLILGVPSHQPQPSSVVKTMMIDNHDVDVDVHESRTGCSSDFLKKVAVDLDMAVAVDGSTEQNLVDSPGNLESTVAGNGRSTQCTSHVPTKVHE